jgi:WD40 repeat protein
VVDTGRPHPEAKAITLCDIRTGNEMAAIKLRAPTRAMAFNPNDKTQASGGGWNDTIIRLWDLKTGKNIATLRGREPHQQLTAVSRLVVTRSRFRIASSNSCRGLMPVLISRHFLSDSKQRS